MTSPSDALVLCYHSIGTARSVLETSATELEWQLSYLAGLGYRGVAFAEAAGRATSGRLVAVTFDDGSDTVASAARPILERLGFVGTVFVPAATVGSPGLLDWAQLAELQSSGWEIGSHAMTHRDLAELSDADLGEELMRSRERLGESLSRPCRSLAYPFGRADRRVIAAAAAAGYQAACVVGGGTVDADRLAIPRVGISSYDGRIAFRAKVSRPIRRLRGSPLAPLLDSGGRGIRRALRR